MILSWLPVIWLDVLGSLLTLGLAVLCLVRAWHWRNAAREELFREFVVLLTVGFTVFAISRSVGHLIKQLLLFLDQPSLWQALSPYSGAVNSAAFIVAFGVSLSFHRFQWINDQLRRQRDRLEEAVVHRTAHLGEVNRLLEEENRARLQALQALADERQRLTVTLRSIGDGVITTDRNGRIVLLNQVAEELCGWPETEALGRPLPEVFRLVDHRSGQAVANPVDKVLATGELVELANHVAIVARDGTVRRIADSGAPIIDLDGQIIGAVLVFRDVTEKERLVEESFRAQKLESVGVLAGGIAHDFNNILTAVYGNVSLALRQLPAGQPVAELLEAAEKAIIRASGLSRQLLTFAKGGAPVRQIVRLAAVIRESAELALRGSNVRAEIKIADDFWPAEADSGQIAQVVQNIVVNSRQAMAEGGVLHLCCENFHGSPPGLGKGDWLRITFADQGPGIPAELRARIFDPYFTTKREGSGLGLAICHAIASKHDGTITVAPNPGGGTVFTLFLPAATGAAGAQAEPAAAMPRVVPHRVLVMDDEPIVAEVLRKMLESLGHLVTVAGDGAAAEAAWEQGLREGRGYDWGILDLTVPGGLGGLYAVKAILRLDPQAKLIVASGYADDPVLADPGGYGFRGRLVKPCRLEELEAIVGRAA